MTPIARAVIRAAASAGVLSGIPSTAHALVTGRNPFDTVRAAGTIVVSDDAPPKPRFVAGLAAHGAITVLWTVVLAILLPRRRTALWGALAGAGIAALDLGIAQRRFPAIAALPRSAQIADHLAFGAIVGLVLGRTRRRAARPRSSAGSASD
jgi:hypothetical protein